MTKNYISNKDETVRMFASNFLEFFSKVHFSVPLFVFVPIISYFIYLGIYSYRITTITFSSILLIGIIVWSLTEYTLHRFVFHFEAKSEFGKKIHFIFHGVHHDYPNDSKRLVMPPAVSVPLATLFYLAFYLILGKILDAPFFAGFLIGYLCYDMIHYAIHHHNMYNPIWLSIKNHHMRHHYQDPNKGFGVSSPLWDEIIGTSFQKSKHLQEKTKSV